MDLFPLDYLQDKICLSLNGSYKAHPAITPIAFMHHQLYAHAGPDVSDPYHPNFEGIRYPVVKATGRERLETVDWDHPYFYYFDWSHDIESIWTLTKETDHLIYAAEGCALQAALQLCWIMGASNIFTIGCDSRTLGGRHYSTFDQGGFRDQDQTKTGDSRNYDAYIHGTLVVREFLKRKNIRLINLSPIIGYHLVDYQFDVLSETVSLEDVYEKARKT